MLAIKKRTIVVARDTHRLLSFMTRKAYAFWGISWTLNFFNSSFLFNGFGKTNLKVPIVLPRTFFRSLRTNDSFGMITLPRFERSPPISLNSTTTFYKSCVKVPQWYRTTSYNASTRLVQPLIILLAIVRQRSNQFCTVFHHTKKNPDKSFKEFSVSTMFSLTFFVPLFKGSKPFLFPQFFCCFCPWIWPHSCNARHVKKGWLWPSRASPLWQRKCQKMHFETPIIAHDFTH